MEKLIFGNLKMNFNQKETNLYLEKLIPLVKDCKNKIALFVPDVYLMPCSQKLAATNIKLGAQNVSYFKNNGPTGEISAKMLKDYCKMVLVGHYDRKKYFSETTEQINQKIKNLLECGLKIVLCVGETKSERVGKRTKTAVEKQVSECLRGLYENELNNIIIAYEPIWAIGSSAAATLTQIQEGTDAIRNAIKTDFSETASKKIKILYGGSVDYANAGIILPCKNINGMLLGKTALSAAEFAKICSL